MAEIFEERHFFVDQAHRFFSEKEYRAALKFLRIANVHGSSRIIKELIKKIKKLAGILSEDNSSSDSFRKPIVIEEDIERILNSRNLYEVLGVEINVTKDELTKEYHRLILAVHPDKQASTDDKLLNAASRVVLNAYNVLSDPNQRSQYDKQLFLEKEKKNEYEILTVKQLFKKFFEKHQQFLKTVPRKTPYKSELDVAVDHKVARKCLLVFFVGIPTCLVITSLVISQLSGSAEKKLLPYSIFASENYPIKRETKNLHVKYYVQETFLSLNKGSIRKFERDIEEWHVTDLRNKCMEEKEKKTNLIKRMQLEGNSYGETIARKMKTPSCQTLNDMLVLGHDWRSYIAS